MFSCQKKTGLFLSALLHQKERCRIPVRRCPLDREWDRSERLTLASGLCRACQRLPAIADRIDTAVSTPAQAISRAAGRKTRPAITSAAARAARFRFIFLKVKFIFILFTTFLFLSRCKGDGGALFVPELLFDQPLGCQRHRKFSRRDQAHTAPGDGFGQL